MASPQVEDGYTRIANEIIDALMRINLSPYQSRILWAIWRTTYGFQKKQDWISNGQLVEMTGIKKSHVSRTMRELRERHIVTSSGNKIAFNKDYQQWRELPKLVTVTSRGNKVTSTGKIVTNLGNIVTSTGEHKRKKITKEKNKGDFVFELPEKIDAKVWNAFIEHRKNLKKPLTEWAKKLIVDRLESIGGDFNALINQSIECGWQKIYPLKEEYKRPTPTTPDSHQEPVYAISKSKHGQWYNGNQEITEAEAKKILAERKKDGMADNVKEFLGGVL